MSLENKTVIEINQLIIDQLEASFNQPVSYTHLTLPTILLV